MRHLARYYASVSLSHSSSHSPIKSSACLRVNGLELENRQLQDRTLKLSNQVSCLERALRNVQSFCSLEVEAPPHST